MVFGASLWSCAGCGGGWVGGKDVSSLFAVVGIPPPPTEHAGHSPSQRRCPEDGALMRVLVHRSVVLEVCLTCRGVWADSGELRQLARRDSPPAEEPEKPEKPSLDDVEDRPLGLRRVVWVLLLVAATLAFGLSTLQKGTVPPANPLHEREQAMQAAAAGCESDKRPFDQRPRICRRMLLKESFEKNLEKGLERERTVTYAYSLVGMACASLVAAGQITPAIWVCAGGFAGVAKYSYHLKRRILAASENLEDMRQPVPPDMDRQSTQ